ncbi:MAG: histidinol-phosphate transaminase [Oscillospiraceae bacterium]|nr:histidinol-phosphate transaminase [Oscillospiraceae bacterium]
MSRFFSEKYSSLTPYTPGEQPQDMKYVKLNTNESPFPTSQKAVDAAAEAAKRLQLYSDPEARALTAKFCEVFGFERDEVIFTNGSDEVLNFAFMAFCDETHGAVFPNISYGFYPVFAELNRVPYTELPLRHDFTIDVDAYCGVGKTIFIANPNAPTGIALKRAEIEKILRSNPNNVVVIDEAYVDFGAESCLPLVRTYDNLLVAQTFSKSRSMAGARLGFGVGNPALIRDLNTIKYSTNPYNVNAMTMAAGIGVLSDEAYTQRNCQAIQENRAFTVDALRSMGFAVTDSVANFIFIRHIMVDGETIYRKLKERGVLVRHFTKPAICDYNRVTIGTREQMQILLDTLRDILKEGV